MNKTGVSILLILICHSCTNETSKDNDDGWEKATWEEFDNCTIRIVCPDDAEKCESDVRWRDLEEELENATSTVMIDNESNLQKKQDIPINLERGKDNARNVTFVKISDNESCVKFYATNRSLLNPRLAADPGNNTGTGTNDTGTGNNTTGDTEEVRRGWELVNWEKYKDCSIQEVCPDDSEHCESKIRWGDLEKEREMIAIDVPKSLEKVQKIEKSALETLKENICDLAFVKRRNSSAKCMLWRPQNTCQWHPIFPLSKNCQYQTINKPDFQDFPRNCELGPGWNGLLELEVQNGSYKLNWAALVKQPRCVESVALTDEEANKEKNFWTLENDDTFPIEYLNSTCDMKIRIFYKFGRTKKYGCYSVNTKVQCKNDDEVKLRARAAFTETENDSETDSASAG